MLTHNSILLTQNSPGCCGAQHEEKGVLQKRSMCARGDQDHSLFSEPTMPKKASLPKHSKISVNYTTFITEANM